MNKRFVRSFKRRCWSTNNSVKKENQKVIMQPDSFQYNPFYFEDLCDILQLHTRGFDRSQFILRIFNNAWPDLDFAERSRHIALVVQHFLGADFNASMKILHRVVEFSERRKTEAFPTA